MKMEFANMICEADNGLAYPNMTECERYGITWGCDKDCVIEFYKKKASEENG